MAKWIGSKMKILIVMMTLSTMLAGCCSQVNEQRIKGIVDACYVNRTDEQKVRVYLQKKQQNGEISKQGVVIIREYIKRSNLEK